MLEETEWALRAMVESAPNYPTFSALFRALNEAEDLDWNAWKWRGILQRNPSVKDRVKRMLGTGGMVHGQDLDILADEIKGVVTSDEHAPYHDPAAIGMAADIMSWFKPDVWVMAGDQLDFYSLSTYDKNPQRVWGLQEEIDRWRDEVYTPLARAAGQKCRKVKIDGNHEHRLHRFLYRNPEVYGLRTLNMENLLGLDSLGVEYASRKVTINGALEISHGKYVRKWSGYSARAEAEKRRYGLSVITGHVHRYGVFTTKVGDRWITAHENPCLCTLEPEYMDAPDWRHGITLFALKGDRVSIQTIPFDGGAAYALGRWFRAR